MQDLFQLLANLKRPRVLTRAARYGLSNYRRDRDLTQVLLEPAPANPERAIYALLDAESELEGARIAGDVTYSARRHIALLIALMAEARLIPRPGPKAV